MCARVCAGQKHRQDVLRVTVLGGFRPVLLFFCSSTEGRRAAGFTRVSFSPSSLALNSLISAPRECVDSFAVVPLFLHAPVPKYVMREIMDSSPGKHCAKTRISSSLSDLCQPLSVIILPLNNVWRFSKWTD